MAASGVHQGRRAHAIVSGALKRNTFILYVISCQSVGVCVCACVRAPPRVCVRAPPLPHPGGGGELAGRATHLTLPSLSLSKILREDVACVAEQ